MKVIDLFWSRTNTFNLAGKTEAAKVTGLEIQEEMVEMALRALDIINRGSLILLLGT